MKAYANPALRAAIAVQQRANRSTVDEWERFATHRAHVTRLLLEKGSAAPSPTLCVLGAGNCNDVDLAQVAAVYERIELVDLDVQALSGAVARHAPAVREKIGCHAPLDVSGVLGRLPQWRRMNTSESELLSLPQLHAQRIADVLGRRFDCVLSCGLLTQLHLPIVEALGAEHPLFEAATQTLLLTHLRLLRGLTSGGGCALLVTELTSNLTLPALDETLSSAELARLFDVVVRQGNVMRIADPIGLRQVIADDPLLRELRVSFGAESEGAESEGAGSEGTVSPWLWEQGPKRRYLTYALCLKRLRRTRTDPLISDTK